MREPAGKDGDGAAGCHVKDNFAGSVGEENDVARANGDAARTLELCIDARARKAAQG